MTDAYVCTSNMHMIAVNDSYMRDMTHSYVCRDSSIQVTWSRDIMISVYVGTDTLPCIYSYMWHDSFIFETWLVHMCGMTRSNKLFWNCRYNESIRVTRLIHMCDMTHSYLGYDSFTCVTWPIQICRYLWLIHMGDMTRSYVCLDSSIYICVIWLIHMGDLTRSYVWHDSFK